MAHTTLAELISELANRMKGRKYAFVGAVGVRAYGIPKRTFDMGLIAKTAEDFEAACLSLAGIGLKETKPRDGFVPGFARWRGEELGADVVLKRLWFRTEAGGKYIELKITPDEEFWRDIRFRGGEVFGADIPVPKPVDLAVLKAASSASPCRSSLKTWHDREHATELIKRFKISREELRKRAQAMGCFELVEQFLVSSGFHQIGRTSPDEARED